MKIICYGDSNTYGFDPRIGTPGRHDKNDRWTGILDNMPEYEIINEGMNGKHHQAQHVRRYPAHYARHE